jgi:hypothetical protein
MSALDLQKLYAKSGDGLLHIAFDRESNWWRVFTWNHSFGGTAWLDESTALAEAIATEPDKGWTVKVHKKTPMRKR